MKHPRSIAILLGLITFATLSACLLLAGTVRADYVDSCVLLPDLDGYAETMTPSTGTDDYPCVDDSNDTVCELGDTTDYIWGGSGVTQMFGHTTAPDTSYGLDSMAMYIEVAELTSGTGGEWVVIMGWRYDPDGLGDWYYGMYSYDDHHAMDTISFSGMTCTSHRHSWTKDPCWNEERGLGWVYFGWTYDVHPGEPAYQWVTDVIGSETGCFPECYWRIYNWWWVGYFTVTEAAEGGNPRRNREIRQRLRGGSDEEDMGFRCRLAAADYRQ